MNEQDEFLRALDLESSLPSCSPAQREANIHRKRMYLLFMNRKPNDTATTHTDLQLDLYVRKMTNPSFRFSASTLMKE